MALDSKLTQNINLRANGDQLLRPLQAFGKEIDKVIKSLGKMADGMTAGNHKSEDSLRKQVQLLQRLVGEASTLQNILNSSNNRKTLGGLDEQSMGRRAASAAKLGRDLDKAKTSADALEIRLQQLYKRFNDLNNAGKTVGQRDLSKALGTEEALRQVRQLEREIARLDSRVGAGKGLSSQGQQLRADLQRAQDTLLSRVQNGRRVDWTKEIGQVQALADKYRQLARAESMAADAAQRNAAANRQAILRNINQSDAMLRASLERGASRYKYTPEQARGFDMRQINTQIDAGTAKLNQYRDAMSRAMQQGRSQAVVDRLAQSFTNLKDRISEAIAQKRAFDNLPEQRMQRLNSMLFGDGGMAFGARIGGAALISTAVFGMINAVQAGIRNVIEFEDALKRLQAIAGATDIEMQKMSEGILRVAQNSRYSTVEITQAATQIAQAGFSAQETTAVLQDALSLATASGSSPNEAVDTLTSALGAFQLQASESGRVVDTLVQGLNRSKLSINQMQAAIQYAGATAHESGIRFEELTAISASLANAGIRSGSTIGTGMRQLLVDMRTPSEDFRHELEALGLTMADVDVKALGMAEVVKRLTDAGFSAEAAYASFEVRAASAFLAFRNQIGTYDQLALSIAQAGAAQEAQATAMDSLSAKWTRMLNNVGALISSLSGPLLNALKTVVDAVAVVADIFTKLSDLTGGLAGKLLILIPAFAINPILGFATALAMLIGELRNTTAETERLTAAANEAQAEFDSQIDTINAVDQAIADLITREETLRNNSVALQTETTTLSSRFQDLSTHLAGAATNYDSLLAAMLRYRGEQLRQAAVESEHVKLTSQEEKNGFVTTLRGTDDTLRSRAEGSLFANNPNMRGAYNFVQGMGNRDVSSMNGQQLQTEITNTLAAANSIRRMEQRSNFDNEVLRHFEDRVRVLRSIASAQGRVELAERNIGIYNERASEEGQRRDGYIIDAQRGIDQGTRANNERAGAGEATINRTLSTANNRLAVLRRQLQNMDQGTREGPRGITLSSQITQLEAQVARVTRTRAAEAREREKNDDGPDATAGNQQDITLAKPGAGFTHTSGYSLSRTVRANGRTVTRPHRAHDYGARAGHPIQAAGPGTVTHAGPMGELGNAVIIDHGNGIETVYGHMQDGSIRVGVGQEVTKGAHIGGVGSTGRSTGNHLHFEVRQNQQKVDPNRTGWRFRINPAQSGARAEQLQQSEAEKQARELQQLMEAQAESGVGEQRARISRITNEARNGTRPVGELTQDMNDAMLDYSNAKLNAFDVANPIEGLSDTLKEARTLARNALIEQLREEVGNFHAQFYRHIADNAANLLDAALAAADRAFERASYAAQDPVRQAEHRTAVLGNRTNRNRFGEGTQYLQERENERAANQADVNQLAALATRATAERAALRQYEDQIKNLREGTEEHTQAVARRQAAEDKLNKTLREQAELQGRVNARTEEYTDVPLKERLEGAAQAWLENSGAMDSWAKQAENAVGPTLDHLRDSLTDMFTSIMDGSKSVKQALGDFLKSFAQFVLQMIARALALYVVKQILTAIGVPMPQGAYEGGPVRDPGQGNAEAGRRAFTGGPVIVGRYAGGKTLNKLPGGGKVRQGFSTHDSALYNLAEGEYVVRNKSVRELGIPFMDAINKHGAKGLAKMGGVGNAIVQAPRQETNVWVVPGEKKPQMGPRDILVVMHEDILQGGTTKKLIKQVAQGG